jgi:thiol-disulfide isomerase/thioredoxin
MKYKIVLIAMLGLASLSVTASTQTLPDIFLPDLNGDQQSLRQWQGKKLLINFWATWCAPCRKEMPDLDGWQSELKQKGLQVVGVALDNAKSVRAYLQDNPVKYPILLAPEVGTFLSAELGNRLGVLPFSVFVGRDGSVEFTHTGLITRDIVVKWLNQFDNQQ